MTNETFLFNEDCKEKKRTARSAKSKVGRGGKRVRFPSDFLTKRELENMNSDVRTYDITKPMRWVEYKSMPEDLHREYQLRLRNLYNVSSKKVGAMFGVADQTVRREWICLGLPERDRSTNTDPAWDNFIRYSGKDVSTIADIIPPEVKAKLDKCEGKHPPTVITKEEIPPHNMLSAKAYGDLHFASGCINTLRVIYATENNIPIYDKALDCIGQILKSVEVFV